MVADALVYHPVVTQYLKLVATTGKPPIPRPIPTQLTPPPTVGRDKLLRMVQYFARFYAWYLLRLNATAAEIAPYEAIKKQFSFIRKGMRLGKFVEHFRAASVAADATGMDTIVRITTIGRQLGYAGYLTLDNLNFLDTAGIKKSEGAKRRAELANQSWFTGISFSIACGMYKLWQLRARESSVDKNSAESAVESKKIEKYVCSVWLSN